MRPIDGTELKSVELKILKYLSDICAENGLRYYLCGGTLIGAVRHKGFIPWDDDIDVDMPRPDYERLKEILRDDPRYRLLTFDDGSCYYNYGKLIDKKTILEEHNRTVPIENMGVYIDIFPLDGLPDNKLMSVLHYKIALFLKGMIFYFAENGPDYKKNPALKLMQKLRWEISKKLGIKRLGRLYTNHVRKYDFDKSKMVFSGGGIYKDKEIIPGWYFNDTVYMKFEEYEFALPSGYDAFLTRMYGDYMKLPPKEDQVPNHDFEAYWKE